MNTIEKDIINNYEQIKDNGKFTIDTEKQILALICCDCGLVHNMDLKIKDKSVIFKVTREDKLTKIHRSSHISSIKKIISTFNKFVKNHIQQ